MVWVRTPSLPCARTGPTSVPWGFETMPRTTARLDSAVVESIGIDIGGTKILGAVVGEDGTILRQLRRPTPAQDGDAILDAVATMVRILGEDTGIRHAGVAAPGFVDLDRSVVYHAPNIDWHNEPVRARLEERLPGWRVSLDNDANAAGWAEWRFGAGRGVHDMVLLTIGTGVGGAIIAAGKLLRGGFGTAGELGHMLLVPGGRLCGCERRGCLEQYGSGRALMRYAGELADAGGLGMGLARLREQRGNIDAGGFAELARAADPGAIEALRMVGQRLGQATATLSSVLDPELFVFGGGVSIAGDLLIEPIRQAYLAHLPARGARPEAGFAVAALGNAAGVVGAADLSRSRGGAPGSAD